MATQQLTPSGRLPRVESINSRTRYSHSPEKRFEVLDTAQALTRAKLMQVVWEKPLQGKNCQIGFIAHSPALRQALDEGKLDQLLFKLSDTYREVYGDAPWEEYLCCSNPECSGKLSLSEIFFEEDDRPLSEKEEARMMAPADYICPEDGAPMEYYYDPEEHLSSLRQAFQEKLFTTLLFVDDHRVMGFCMGFETTVKDGWDDKIIAGQGDSHRENLPYEEYLEEALSLFGGNTQEDSKVLNVAEWASQNSIRRNGAALALMKTLYEQALIHMREDEDSDVPVFAHSLHNSPAYKITSRMGFQWGKILPSGEQRAYLTLQKAIKGIDRMMMKNSVQHLPVKHFETLENPEIPRDTLVIELLTDEAVGTDAAGTQKIHDYLADLSHMLGVSPIAASATHLSPKYGLSGWLPLENGGAIHLYAWDYEQEDHTPFVSVDISLPDVITNPDRIQAHAHKTFNATSPIVKKSLQEAQPNQWHELAPQILRQRISIAGTSETPITSQQVKDYLKDLAPTLDMVQLSEPLIIGNNAWIHWETSGVVAHWTENEISIDIYTCKAFDPDTAVQFTKTRFAITNPAHKSF